ncbi:iron response transcriptional regulator IrrA [Notoacmeibacter ruber]|uniref:Ferric uptake regulation protein n=1 Tax=Notoacmeibacter ruber TaxID=2670375 RepID=A0A3L7JF52_9HYPH|nr:transcriptional repressor [Notoacmeibacter ruber]
MTVSTQSHLQTAGSPCWASRLRDRMRDHGLRPTRQRMHLATLLFTRGNRHVTAEEIHAEAHGEGVSVSLATVYNTLHQFTEAGLLRVLSIETNKTYFDTDVSDHHHFLVDGGAQLFDIPEGSLEMGRLPTPPEGYEIAHVDVVIRLRRKD